MRKGRSHPSLPLPLSGIGVSPGRCRPIARVVDSSVASSTRSAVFRTAGGAVHSSSHSCLIPALYHLDRAVRTFQRSSASPSPTCPQCTPEHRRTCVSASNVRVSQSEHLQSPARYCTSHAVSLRCTVGALNEAPLRSASAPDNASRASPVSP